jgi:hypothetical protein
MRPDGSYPGARRREFFNPKTGPKKGAVPGGSFLTQRSDQRRGRRSQKAIVALARNDLRLGKDPDRDRPLVVKATNKNGDPVSNAYRIGTWCLGHG